MNDFLAPEDAAKARSVRWDTVLRESVIVGITIKNWYPHATLDLDDLGIKAQSVAGGEAVARVVHGTKVDLVPALVYRPIRALSGRIRMNLSSKANTVVWGHLLSARAYPAWKDEHETLAAQWRQVVDNLVENLSSHVADARRDHWAVFGDAYDRLLKLRVADGDPPQRWPREEFIGRCIESLVVPSESEVRRAYSLDVSFSYPETSEEVAEKERRAFELRKALTADEVAMDDERRRILQAMQADVAAQVEVRRQQIEQSLVEAEAAFYDQVSSVVANLRAGLTQRGGVLIGRAAIQARSLIDQVKSLNVFGNDGLDNAIAGLEQAVGEHVGSRDRDVSLANLNRELSAVAASAQQPLRSLPQARGIRLVEVADEAIDEQRNLSRHVQQPDEADIEPITLRRRTVGAAN